MAHPLSVIDEKENNWEPFLSTSFPSNKIELKPQNGTRNEKQVTVARSMFERFIKMARSLEFLIFLCLLVFVFSKELHMKQTLETKDKDIKGFMNIFNNQDVLMKNERYARHVKAVTESVLDHLISEIKHQYLSGNYNANSPIPRLIRNLNMELKRNERSKLQKEKAKRKNATKKKNKRGKNKSIMTTTSSKSMLGNNKNGKEKKNNKKEHRTNKFMKQML